MLFRLPDRTTLQRSPGLGPIRLRDWRPYAKRLLSQRRVILHSDSARAYKYPIQGVPHVSVIHCKKKIDNKWVSPHYVRYTSVDLPDGQRLRVVGGTQYLDGLWRHLRVATRGHQSNGDVLVKMLRVAQWRMWNSNVDLVKALADTAKVK